MRATVTTLSATFLLIFSLFVSAPQAHAISDMENLIIAFGDSVIFGNADPGSMDLPSLDNVLTYNTVTSQWEPAQYGVNAGRPGAFSPAFVFAGMISEKFGMVVKVLFFPFDGTSTQDWKNTLMPTLLSIYDNIKLSEPELAPFAYISTLGSIDYAMGAADTRHNHYMIFQNLHLHIGLPEVPSFSFGINPLAPYSGSGPNVGHYNSILEQTMELIPNGHFISTQNIRLMPNDPAHFNDVGNIQAADRLNEEYLDFLHTSIKLSGGK